MTAGIRVIELADGIAGPLAGGRLAELGASVVKVEPPEGDWLRGAAPAMPDSEDSAAFYHLNRGKRSLAMGERPLTGASLLLKLMEQADVLITDRGDAQLREMGLADLSEDDCPRFPRLIRVHITPFGRRGPISHYQGSELTAQAMAGYTRYLGRHGEPSCRLGADVASTGTGTFAVQAVLAGLFARRRSGQGQRIDLSLLNSLLSLKSIHIAAQGDPDVFAGPRVGGANYPPERGWKTGDEPLFFSFGGSVGAEGRPGWVEFIKEIGATHLLEDKRFDHKGRNSTGHGTDVNPLRPIYEEAFAKFSGDYLVDVIRKHAGNAARYMRADETMAHPQTAALGILRDVRASSGKMHRVRAFPVRFSRTKTSIYEHAPSLGQHTEAIALEAGIGSAELQRMRTAGGLR